MTNKEYVKKKIAEVSFSDMQKAVDSLPNIDMKLDFKSKQDEGESNGEV